MDKFFRIPFAQSGDKTAVPDDVDAGGAVSYTQGYGPDYERPRTDPASKNIEREKMNQLHYAMTVALSELQSKGVPDFITTALNGGVAYSYAKNAIVRWTDGEIYMSLLAANTATPADRTKWALVGIDLTIIRGDGVTDNSAEIAAANTRGLPVLPIGVLHVASATTMTVPLLGDIVFRIFTDASQITLDNGNPVRPEWFGSTAGNIMRAVNALPAAGGVVKLQDNKTYPPSYNTLTAAKILANTGVAGTDYLAKANVTLCGGRLPVFNSGNTALAGGTIIQGPFAVFANGFRCDKVGFDSGSDVVTALYAGVAQDAFFFGKPNHVVGAGTYALDVQIGSIIGLGSDPAAAGHAVLIEAINGGTVQYAEGRKALHGVVIKSQSMICGTLIGRENTLEGVICKSDNYAPLSDVVINHVEAGSLDATLDTGFGFLIDSVTTGGGKVQVDSVKVISKTTGVAVRNNGAVTADVQIGQVQTEGCPTGVLFSGDVRRVTFGDVQANNCTYGVQVEPTVTSQLVSINSLKVTNATSSIYLGGKLAVDNMSSDNLSSYAVNYYDVAARLLLGLHREVTVPSFWLQQPTFAGTWANLGGAGNPSMALRLDGGRVRLSGAITGGGASTILNTLSVQIRPAENVRVVCSGFNGSTLVPVDLQITTAGAVTIPNFASAPTSIWLNADWPIPA